MANCPPELKYTREHEWARIEGNRATIGITDFAQDALGDIVYVDLPAVGTAVNAGQPLGEIESTKSVSDVYSPVDGTVAERNDALDQGPDTVNSDPYGDGWLLVIESDGTLDESALLDAGAYEELIAQGPAE